MADTKISALPASTVPLAGTEVLPIVQSSSTKQVSVANLTAGRDVSALSITTPTYKAANSAGGALQNASGVNQLQWGAGGGNNVSVDVAITINPANAAVAISPTGTGTVAISPAGALTINPTAASTINNTSIGATTALTGRFTSVTATTGNVVIGTSGQGIDFSATPGTGTSELLADYEEGTFTATLTADTPPSSSLTTTGHYTKIGRLVTVMVDFSNYDTTGASGVYYITGLPFTSANNGTINYGVLATFNFAVETGCAAITANTSRIILAPTYGASLTTSIAGSGKYIRATINYIAA